jgi:hypothetical protein
MDLINVIFKSLKVGPTCDFSNHSDYPFKGIIKTKYEGVGGITNKLWYFHYMYPLSC